MRRLLFALSTAVFVLPLVAGAQGSIIPRPCLPNRVCPRPGPWGLERTASHVRVTMDDRVLHYEVEERFTNRGGALAEADYIFPLPTDAAFQDLKLSINGELVSGETMNANQARGIYEEIVRRQRDPALVEWMGHGLLRARIFPIAPGEEKRVVVRFEAVARREGDALRIDYRRGDQPRSAGPIMPPLMRDDGMQPGVATPRDDSGDRGDRGEAETFSLSLPEAEALGTPYSPTHRLVRRVSNGRVVVEAEGRTSDVTVLVPLRSSDDPSVSVLANATSDRERFALITLTPPTRTARHTPRDVTLVLDVSGSMSGRKLVQAKAAGRQVLGTLDAADRFRIIDFSTDVRSFRDAFVPATAANVREAQRYLDALEAQGSTNISGALDEALRNDRSDERLPLVLFLTDGAPTVGETQPDVVAAAAARQRGRARVFTFGVGADVNAALIERLALEAHGTATFVRPEEDVERAVSIVASRLTDPIVTDLRVRAEGVRLDRVLPSGPIDLFAGQDLVVLARYDGDGPATLRFSGRSANGPVEWTERVNFPERERGNAFVPRLWATQRVGWLSAGKRRGVSNAEIDDEIRTLGERYAIPTEFTSYLVQEPGMVANGPMVRNQSIGTGAVGQAFGTATAVPPSAPAPERDFMRAKAAASQRESRDLAMADSQLEMRAEATASRRIGARFFTLRDSVWTDARVDARGASRIRKIRVQPYSDAYFALIRALPELGEPFGLGDRVLVVGRAVAIEVGASGDERMSEAQVAAVKADW